ncbi:MAG: three-Cys-motif partner protein TcmP [Chloroflexota bacterium]|uniref:Three-Cys-motif partner protein TcmP n=1 Tax=Candidatus Thermofonsia Clade 1 bacterium TaxID=2364210 RepID=A0A2M8PYQ7_9CHLR|nr:MAG: hypothetical protein CUN50_03220 [Candidatus Thermofonsia Clade 1 bacterium]RMF54090.1 MAG: three-Cys-motif partner protein TcmP [Chloroflexota bacterium]
MGMPIKKSRRFVRRSTKWIAIEAKCGGSLNLAFVDPEGPEDLNWHTIHRLAQVNRMDMIINFPTSGITRLFASENYETVDKFFGTDEWRQNTLREEKAAVKRRRWIDLYRRRLQPYGYHVVTSEDVSALREYIARNSRNAQLYTLIFVSKHELGDKLWQGVLDYLKQRRLF